MRRVCVIFNPAAGRGVATGLAAALECDPAVTLRRVVHPEAIGELARAAAAEGYEIVAAAGGDGTAGAVAAGLHEASTGALLALLPIGTGNDFARHLGIPRDPLAALRAALDAADAGRARWVDLIRCLSPREPERPRWALNAVVGGLAGRIADALEPDRRRRWGRLVYLRAGLAELRHARPHAVRLTVDRRRFEFEALMIVVAGGRFAGGGIPFAPKADPSDGRLDVVAILRTPGPLIPSTVLRILRARHPGSDNVLMLDGREVEIEADPDFWMNVDGETWTAGRANFDVVPGALAVLVS